MSGGSIFKQPVEIHAPGKNAFDLSHTKKLEFGHVSEPGFGEIAACDDAVFHPVVVALGVVGFV